MNKSGGYDELLALLAGPADFWDRPAGDWPARTGATAGIQPGVREARQDANAAYLLGTKALRRNDLDSAEGWFAAACDQQHPGAAFRAALARLLAMTSDTTVLRGQVGSGKSHAVAAQMVAQTRRGTTCILRGQVGSGKTRAFILLTTAARWGHADAAHLIGRLRTGNGHCVTDAASSLGEVTVTADDDLTGMVLMADTAPYAPQDAEFYPITQALLRQCFAPRQPAKQPPTCPERQPGVAERQWEDPAPGGVPAQLDRCEDGVLPPSWKLPLSDAGLIEQMRSGDDTAYEELYRRHADAVRRYARTCCRDAHTADDLTAEVFARMLQAVRGDSGPERAVRAYLLASVRRVAATWTKSARREQLVDDFAVFAAQAVHSSEVSDDDTRNLGAAVCAMHEAEQSMAMQAFRSLPERWQAMLWHIEVEDESPSEVATLFGLDANGTRVLASRAREGLKQAYLQAHANATLVADNAWEQQWFSMRHPIVLWSRQCARCEAASTPWVRGGSQRECPTCVHEPTSLSCGVGRGSHTALLWDDPHALSTEAPVAGRAQHPRSSPARITDFTHRTFHAYLRGSMDTSPTPAAARSAFRGRLRAERLREQRAADRALLLATALCDDAGSSHAEQVAASLLNASLSITKLATGIELYRPSLHMVRDETQRLYLFTDPRVGLGDPEEPRLAVPTIVSSPPDNTEEPAQPTTAKASPPSGHPIPREHSHADPLQVYAFRA
ncbi:RNA polymerase sigma factor [Streptomyces sp. NPDC057623]|uniref:RNA polymerase sigma factor n=1 Tax=Streptomyces sp. NPDC057623 TaxID=3346187 RepID=UPI00369CE16E